MNILFECLSDISLDFDYNTEHSERESKRGSNCNIIGTLLILRQLHTTIPDDLCQHFHLLLNITKYV